MKKYLAELIGSFYLVLALGLTGNALASGLLIIPVIYFGAKISGAHYNPAVTMAYWATGSLSQKSMWIYILSQTTGALIGCLVIFYLAGTAFQTIPSTASTPVQYGLIELLFVFLLCTLYLTLFLTESFRDNNIHGLVIGLSYAGILLIGEPITGSSFNPSVAAAASIVDYFDFGESYLYLPLFILAPAVGGLLSGNLFTFLLRRESGRQAEE
jgi:glycerol uptake facilitator-like aquaporin